MPEFPEIYNLSEQLNIEIINLKITEAIIYQEKCLNIEVEDFQNLIKDQTIMNVTSKGKWIEIIFNSFDKLYINLGMGGDLIYSDSIPEKKHQAVIRFGNGNLLSFRFWWFGYIHFVKKDEAHQMTEKLGLDIFRDNVTKDQFVKLIKQRKGSLKSYLLNQKNIAGIGNYYIHDILFKAKINPLKKITEVSARKLGRLYDSIIEEFQDSISKRGSNYEYDIYHNYGGFSADKVAYKEGKLCSCNTIIRKIKTGSTASYYCPKCQK